MLTASAQGAPRRGWGGIRPEGGSGQRPSLPSVADKVPERRERRDDSIVSIMKVLKRQRDSGVRAQLLFKLAELEWEEADYVYQEREWRGFRDDSENWRRCLRDRKAEEKCGDEPVFSTKTSDELRLDAVERLRGILSDSPDYSHSAKVRFALAMRLSALSANSPEGSLKIAYEKEALELQHDLITKNPDSEFAADAYVQLCDYFFDNRDFGQAEAACMNAVGKHQARTEQYATYRMAWIRNNQGQYGEQDEPTQGSCGAVCYLKQAVALSPGGLPPEHGLKESALQDLVGAFARNGERDGAIEYFVAQYGTVAARHSVAALAEEFFWLGGSQYDDSLRTYRWLLAQAPLAAQAPFWQTMIVSIYDKKGKRQNVLKEAQRLVEGYTEETLWFAAQTDESRTTARATVEKALYNLTLDYHFTAVKTKAIATFKLARDLYKIYLEHFADSAHEVEARFSYAHSLFLLEEYQSAYEQYLLVLSSGDQRFLLLAAKGMLGAVTKVARLEEGTKARSQLVAACERYRAVFAKESPQGTKEDLAMCPP